MPKLLNKILGKLLRSNSTLDNRIALSFLRCYEAIFLQPVEDLTSVTKSSNGNHNFTICQSMFKSFLNKSRFSRQIKDVFSHFMTEARNQNGREAPTLHFSAKSGVGGPTILSAGYQSLSFSKELLMTLIEINESAFNRMS